MQIPRFPEVDHPLIESLSHQSDRQLLSLFQQHPEQGKYFTAIFCRYSPMIYTLVASSAPSPQQRDYFFALTWQSIFAQMKELVLKTETDWEPTTGTSQLNSSSQSFSLQNWLIYTAAAFMKQNQAANKFASYNLKAASPPLWCYLQRALEQLSPNNRFVVTMADKFGWSEVRITAYLQAEGESVSLEEVSNRLQRGHWQLQQALPEDICQIYLLTNQANQTALTTL